MATKKKEPQFMRVFNFLMTGAKLASHESGRMLGVGRLPNRVSEIKKKFKIKIEDRWITIQTQFGDVDVKQYWIENKEKTLC